MTGSGIGFPGEDSPHPQSKATIYAKLVEHITPETKIYLFGMALPAVLVGESC